MQLFHMRSEYVLGLDIGGTRVRVALGSERGEIYASQSCIWPAAGSAEEDIRLIMKLIRKVVQTTSDPTRISSVGVSLAASLDERGVVVSWPNRPMWQGLAVQQRLADELHLPVIIEDDANTAALAEWKMGTAREYRNVLMLMAGTGIGAGIILYGQLLHGKHGWAGEIGHQVMQKDGPLCSCGRRGCLQALASGRALEQEALARGLPPLAFYQEFAKNVPWAMDAVAASGLWLGLAIANAIQLLDLDAIIVGGGLSRLGAFWWDSLRRSVESQLFHRISGSVALLRAMYPEQAGLLGALILASTHVPEALAR